MKRFILSIISVLTLTQFFAQTIPAKGAFPFNHFNLIKDSEISAASMNSEITEKDRITVSPDGHLEADGKRIRIYGTNLSEFPVSHQQAEFAAQSLANQGYNCIRFHHTDAEWTKCFLKKQSNGKWVIDPQGLDNFDYFFYQLKKNGIYSNINLLTGRSISSADGYPSEINGKPWKAIHCLGFWNKNARNHQKEYAFDLLTHVNPYTNTSYKDDPAVAIVEINNENGLIMGYLSGNIDLFTGDLHKELEQKWNLWLTNQKLSYAWLSAKYNIEEISTKPLLSLASNWNLEQHNGAKAAITKGTNTHTIKINKNGTESWHVQYSVSGLTTSTNEIYTLKFSAKSSAACDINIGLQQAHDPWQSSVFSQKIHLTPKTQDFSFTVTNIMDDPNLRLIFSNMGFLEGTSITISNLTFEKGGKLQFVKKASPSNSDSNSSSPQVKFPTLEEYNSSPSEYRNLVMNFLWEEEKNYWTDMKSYLKNQVGSQALFMGTSMGCSSTYLQECFDIIDSHAYWNHPTFPESDWDRNHYYVKNRSLTEAVYDSTLPSLAQYRVYGKPFSVSEYDHPYPNQYNAEDYPMLAAFASFQDWDCIFTFCSNLPKTTALQSVKITDFFDQTNNPAKSCAAPLASRIFRQFLITPATQKIYVPLTEKIERENLHKQQAWVIGAMPIYGANANISLIHQLGYALDGQIPESGTHFATIPSENLTPANAGLSDTNELFWNSGIFYACNPNVTITVYSKKGSYEHKIPSQWKTDSLLLPLLQSDDAATLCAVKENNKYLIFSNSWVGNKGELLREYGKTPQITEPYIHRGSLNLTTHSNLGTGHVLALGAGGSFNFANLSVHTLYKCSLPGNRTSESTTASNFKLNSTDETLWYIIE